MDWLSSIVGAVNDFFAALIAIISFIAWKKVGFKAPTYIHAIAVISSVVGALLAFLGHISDAEHGSKAIWLVVVFPICTYFFFGFLGGGTVMANNEDDYVKGTEK
jgi:lysylphosphatidylglycerol synthetase-like protein (DUF2156 family)